MLFSEATGRKVVSTSTAETVGKIDNFIVDPGEHRVLALALKGTDGGDTLRWSAMTAFGDDAVTVSGADSITQGDDTTGGLWGKSHRMLGKRVLTVQGDEIGSVDDVEFDAGTGVITAIHLASQQVEGVRLVGVGSYAVVVATAPA